MSTSSKTKSELVDEVEELRNKLEDAHSVLSEALGYDSVGDDEEDEEIDEDEDVD